MVVDYFTLDTDDVRFADDGALGRIELNRPKAINALTTPMVTDIGTVLRRWADDDAIAAVAITGAGERGLCAGGDVRAVREAIAAGDLDQPYEFWRSEYAVNAQIADYPKPYVAIMDGIVMGGGVGISAHGNRRLVTERTKIAMPETIIGLFPDVGALWLLANAPGEFGTHLALTGSTIDGPSAITAGLADAMIDSASIPQVLDTLARGESIDELTSVPEPVELPAWLEAYAGDDAAQIVARLEASDDADARAAAEAIRARSPFSVSVTLAALRRAAAMSSVHEVLAQDLVLGRHFLAEPDFAEGVRAQLVDKDRNPKWRHASLDEVDPAEVEAAFTPSDGSAARA